MQPRSGVSNPSSVEIQDEGIVLGHTRKIDFVGGGVTGSLNADKVVISVPTAGGGGGIGTHNIGGAEHGDATVVSPVDMEVLAYEAATSIFKNKKLHGTLLKKTDFIVGGTLELPVSSMADFNAHVGSAGSHHAYPIGSGGVASGAVPFLELRTINPVPSGYSLQAVASGGVPTFAAQVGGGGSSTFVALTDTPANFTGEAGKAARVNSGETALEHSFPTKLQDAGGVTKVDVEEAAAEKKIRMDVNSVEAFLLSDVGILTLAQNSGIWVYRDGVSLDQAIPSSTEIAVWFDITGTDIRSEWDGSSKTGSATSTVANKLVDTGASFVAGDLGRWVWNTTNDTYAKVTAVDSATQLSIDADIMTNGDAYTLYHSKFTATEAGQYLGVAKVRVDDVDDTQLTYGNFLKNGTTNYGLARWYGTQAAHQVEQISVAIIECAIGDTIEVISAQSSGAVQQIRGVAAIATYLNIAKIA